MSSTKQFSTRRPEFDWMSAGLRYYSLNFFYQSKFGRKVRKISLDAGLGCPNRDNSSERSGCIFCAPVSFSPSLRHRAGCVREQIDAAAAKLTHLYGVDRFIAYFQPGTNTHAPIEVLREIFTPAFDHPAVVGVAIGTRPDCLTDEAITLLSAFIGADTANDSASFSQIRLSKPICESCRPQDGSLTAQDPIGHKKALFLEVGLQSISDRSLAWMNRGHDFAAFDEAVDRCHAQGVEVGTHVIFGLPGETTEDAVATARYLSQKNIHSVKIHNLYAVKNTRLGDLVERGEVSLPPFEEFMRQTIAFLEHLSPAVVIERLFSTVAPEYLVSSQRPLDRNAMQQAFTEEFERRDVRQGARFVEAEPRL